ncbi:MAG: PaaX family transcriptional regulator [Micromonosporaceae bacterium]|nr:PaaX family transcriptional regulator [Micromonosporaceae bacterium]
MPTGSPARPTSGGAADLAAIGRSGRPRRGQCAEPGSRFPPYRVCVTTIQQTDDVWAVDGRSAQPRALIVTVYGLYARETGGWLSVSALIRLLAELGVDEPAVRSAISRLKRRGLLTPERRDGLAGYALSDAGRDVLHEGDERIFHRPRATLADGWLLAVFSVPESERQRRHTLRSRLAWLGFGTAAPGVWVAPAHLYDTTRSALERHGLDHYVNLFRADYLAFGDVSELIGSWWDLAGLQDLYGEFVAAYRPVLAKWQRQSPSEREAEAFADWVRALTAWRRLPYLDPGLPAELLPPDWKGTAAADLFTELQQTLAGPAHDLSWLTASWF